MTGSLARRIEAANSVLLVDGRLEAIGEFFSPAYVGHGTNRSMKGHAAIRRFVLMYRRAFPDLRVDVEILVKAGNRVAWQRTLRATHMGDFKGFPATGRAIVWSDGVTSRFQDGLIVEDWVITDLAERLLLARRR